MSASDEPDASRITILLHDAASGKKEAADALIPLVYDQLRRIAQRGRTLRVHASGDGTGA